MASSVSQSRQKQISAAACAVPVDGTNVDSGPATSATLLKRLQHWEDTAAWRVFVDRYQSLLIEWSGRKLANPADVDDVNQQVVWEVARRLRDFRYDPSRSFRGWLRTLHNSRLLDFLKIERRRRLREVDVARVRCPRDSTVAETLTSTALKCRVEAARQVSSARVEAILSSIQSRVTAKTWTIFQDVAVHGQTITETAKRYGMTYTATFAAYSRTCQMLRKEAEAPGQSVMRIPE